MIDWLLDTLMWTGALIALVLLVRRPVAHYLGAQAAYSLWLVPFARLFVPVIELPAGFAPQFDPAPVMAIDPVMLMSMQAPAAATAVEPDTGWLWVALAFAVWLTGAAAMLAWRYTAYFRMRSRLLSQADEKLRIGGIRILESAATDSPLAFGIIDRVVAVPVGFLATADRQTRNLAIAHELAHHERGDLLANFLAQPLFALHWFTPLGWWGWRAMRRDQEAACDARVVAKSDDTTRAAYAQTIARFSAGPDLALAAPMACPVLGEKSIIQRLRTLKMADISPRRRWAGRAALITGLLALPLTASVTYASPGRASETPGPAVLQDEQADTIVIRDVDPDAAPLTEEDAERLAAEMAERAEEIAAQAEDDAERAEEIAERTEKARYVFVRDGKIVTDKAMEGHLKALDERMAELRARGVDVDVKMDMGRMVRVDPAKLAELEALGRDMGRLQVKIENDPEWRQMARGLEELAMQVAESKLPRLALEMQRDLAQNGALADCTVDGNKVDCADIDVSRMQREAIAEARREIARSEELTAEQRRRALRALDRAIPQY